MQAARRVRGFRTVKCLCAVDGLLFLFNSDAVWKRKVLLLSVPDQRPAVDMAADTLLHHLPPVEFQTRVHRLHSPGS